MALKTQPGSEVEAEVYVDGFAPLEPRLAHRILIHRLKSAKSLNDNLIDYFKERLSAEEHYLRALLKLQSRPLFSDPHALSSDSPALSSVVSRSLRDEVAETVKIHSDYRAKLQAEVESPLRSCSLLGGSSFSLRIKPIQDDLDQTIRALEDCQSTLARTGSKLGPAPANDLSEETAVVLTRFSQDSIVLQKSRDECQLKIAQAFRSYQAFDQQRLSKLMETLIRFGTLQVDRYREQGECSQRLMLSLLSVDVHQDMESFAIRHGVLGQPFAESTPLDPSTSPTSASPTSPTPPSHASHATPAPSQRLGSPTRPAGSTPVSPLPTQFAPQPLTASPPPQQESFQAISQANRTEASGFDNAHLATPQANAPPAFLSNSHPPFSSPNGTTSGVAYDPNSINVPRLNGPNISVPLRSTAFDALGETSPPQNATLPPRTLCVQRQSSVRSVSNVYQNTLSKAPAKSSESIVSSQTKHFSESIKGRLFGKSRFASILSRSKGRPPKLGSRAHSEGHSILTGDGTEPGLPSFVEGPSSRQQERISLSQSQGPPSLDTLDQQGEGSSQLRPTSKKDHVGRSEQRSSRFTHLLPSSSSATNLLLRRKNSSSRPSLASPFSFSPSPRSQPRGNETVDSEGFTIPPEDRGRNPWERGDTGVTENLCENSGDDPQDGLGRASPKSDDQNQPAAAGLNSFAIKPAVVAQPQESEADRLAAIEKVKKSLGSARGSRLLSQNVQAGGAGPSVGTLAGCSTGGPNPPLRGRRGQAKSVTVHGSGSLNAVAPSGSTELSTPKHRSSSSDERPEWLPVSLSELKPVASPAHEKVGLAALPSQSPAGRSSTTAGSPPVNALSTNLEWSGSNVLNSSKDRDSRPVADSSAQDSSIAKAFVGEGGQGGRGSRSNSLLSDPKSSSSNINGLSLSSFAKSIGGDNAPLNLQNNPFTNQALTSPSMSSRGFSRLPGSHEQRHQTDKDELMSGVAGEKSLKGASELITFKMVEKLNVLMNEGRVTKILIVGEVGIGVGDCGTRRELLSRLLHGDLAESSFDPLAEKGQGDLGTERVGGKKKNQLSFKIENFERLEKAVLPNPKVFDRVDGEGEEGVYKLDLGELLKMIEQSSGNQEEEKSVLKYRIYYDEPSLSTRGSEILGGGVKMEEEVVPILKVRPRWRVEAEKAELVIDYEVNPKFMGELKHLEFLTSMRRRSITVGGEDGTSSKPADELKVECQSLPAGEFDSGMNRIRWKLRQQSTDMDQDKGEQQGAGALITLKGKLMSRFVNVSLEDELRLSWKAEEIYFDPIEVKFMCGNKLMSGIALKKAVTSPPDNTGPTIEKGHDNDDVDHGRDGQQGVSFVGNERFIVEKLSVSGTFLSR